MRRNCPKGYQMINGVCSETLSSIPGGPGGGGGALLSDCEQGCEQFYLGCGSQGSGMGGCSCDCCFGYWSNCTYVSTGEDVSTWNPETQSWDYDFSGGTDWSQSYQNCDWVCECQGCMMEYNMCMGVCAFYHSGDGGVGAGGSMGGRGWAGGQRSDISLKENIELVGKSKSGINIYEFDYKDKSHGDGRYQGVMAQEVPEASFDNNGYLMVDYSKLDVEFRKI